MFRLHRRATICPVPFTGLCDRGGYVGPPLAATEASFRAVDTLDSRALLSSSHASAERDSPGPVARIPSARNFFAHHPPLHRGFRRGSDHCPLPLLLHPSKACKAAQAPAGSSRGSEGLFVARPLPSRDGGEDLTNSGATYCLGFLGAIREEKG